jgi:hypothetical protein
MSWYVLQTKWRAPIHPLGVIAEPLILKGAYISYLYKGERVISNTTIGPLLKVESSTLIPDWVSYAGYTGFVGGYNVWYNNTYGWVASTLPVGTAIVEYWEYIDPEDEELGGEYKGDSFYTGTIPALGTTKSWVARGSLRGTTLGGAEGTPIDVQTVWDYWKCSDGDYGLFEPEGEASGTYYLGVPQWTYGGDNYPRSATKTNDKYTYGEIGWSASSGKYILGSYGSELGWHESSSAPTIESSWTLQFAKLPESDATGSDITLAWDKWVLGTSQTSIYACRASRWGA